MSSLNLRRLMRAKGIGNKALSEKASIPIGTLNKIIYGETTNPSLEMLTALAQALECTLDDLIDDNFFCNSSINSAPINENETQLLALFRQLNGEGQDKLIDNCRDLVASGRYIKNDEFGLVGEKEA